MKLNIDMEKLYEWTIKGILLSKYKIFIESNIDVILNSAFIDNTKEGILNNGFVKILNDKISLKSGERVSFSEIQEDIKIYKKINYEIFKWK